MVAVALLPSTTSLLVVGHFLLASLPAYFLTAAALVLASAFSNVPWHFSQQNPMVAETVVVWSAFTGLPLTGQVLLTASSAPAVNAQRREATRAAMSFFM